MRAPRRLGNAQFDDDVLAALLPANQIALRKDARLSDGVISILGIREVGTREVGIREVGTREVGIREVGTREVGTARLAPARLAPARLASARLAPARLARALTAAFTASPNLIDGNSSAAHSISAVNITAPEKRLTISCLIF